MTARQVFEYALVEQNKVQAPSLLLEDYNYFINKTINQYINRSYSFYDMNQQKSDDLRVLKSTAILTPTKVNTGYGTSALFNKVYQVDLPDDYLHILNCVVEYEVNRNFKCYNSGDLVHFGASRLTADMFSQIINNYYMRPSYKKPYFYINNVNTDNVYPINETPSPINTGGVVINYFIINFGTPTATNLTLVKNGISTTFTYSAVITLPTQFNDLATLKTALSLINVESIAVGTELLIPNAYATGITSVTENSSYLTITSGTITDTTSLIEKVPGYRYGNTTKVRMEIRYGKDDSLFILKQAYIDYLKAPQFIRLTQSQIDEVEDTSQILEFPDYVCQEITNDLVKLLLENASDPRLQTNIPVNQSILNPAQEQQQKR